MNYQLNFALRLSLSIVLGASATAWSNGFEPVRIGGLTFAIEGEYLFAIEGAPFKIGDTFTNCYRFLEDPTREDALTSGAWENDQFIAPGTWIQHSHAGLYTVVADDGVAVSIAMNGKVKRVRGKRKMRLRAYSTTTLEGVGIIAETLLRGHVVDECPAQ